MQFQLTSIVVDSDPENRKELTGFLSNYGLQVVGQLAGVDQIASVLSRQDAPQLVIINLDPTPRETLTKLGRLPQQFPAASFMLMSQHVDAHLLMDAMHMGVKEFVPVPISQEQFAAAIDRVGERHGLAKKAKIIQVVPTMGGCGSTTVACNVAASLAKTHHTVLLDMDLVRGGVASYFDLRPRYTIADVMDSAEKLDKTLLENALVIHQKCGLAVLARPDLPEDTQRVTLAGFNRLINVLSRMFDFIVIDSIMSIDPLYSAIINAADTTVIVMQFNVPSAKNAERFVGTVRRMGVEPHKLKVVANRFIKKGWDIEPAEVERTLGLKISWMVPNDFKNAIAAINFGEPVVLRAPRAEISTSLTGLAELLSGNTKAAAAA